AIFITAKLLERAPFQYGFKKTDKKRIAQTFGKILTISSEDKCGNLCYEDDTCIGFSYCGSFECVRFYKDSNITFDNNLEEGENCNAYSKLRPNETVGAADSMLDSLLFMLQEEVIHNMFKLEILDTFNPKLDIFLTASELKQNVQPGFSRDYEDAIHLPFVSKPSSFEIAKDVAKSYYVDKRNRRFDFTKLGDFKQKVINVGLGECKQLCDNDPQCKSFSYCTFNEPECILSSVEGEAIVTAITTTSQSCSLLSSKYNY
ncbi:hypothetical protein B4U80_14523, partial [Leptotrombidium deliense]